MPTLSAVPSSNPVKTHRTAANIPDLTSPDQTSLLPYQESPDQHTRQGSRAILFPWLRPVALERVVPGPGLVHDQLEVFGQQVASPDHALAGLPHLFQVCLARGIALVDRATWVTLLLR